MQSNKLSIDDSDYPDLLRELNDAPKTLHIAGDPAVLAQPLAAIVGTRKPTPYGVQTTRELVAILAQAGWGIVSGLAIGLDSVGHEAALRAGAPTVAVLPAGLDRIYPTRHQQLAHRITQSGGALVTEYELGTDIYPSNFVARNRIIAGLCQLLVVPEAAQRSGSLITAAMALDLGRDVFAVPGPIFNQFSQGTNQLIKKGAEPITDLDTWAVELGLGSPTPIYMGNSEEEARVLRAIDSGVHDLAELPARTRLDPAAINRTISILEIKRILHCPGGGQVYRLSSVKSAVNLQ